MKPFILPLLLLVVVVTAIGAFESKDPDKQLPRQHSALFGASGESWDPENGPLRDFTNVGYLEGSVPIPDWPVGVNIRDFGAKGDGQNDDTQAFRDAIAACPESTAVFVPNGTYKILGQIRVEAKDNFVLRGEDMHKTILSLPTYLNEGGDKAVFNADTTKQAVFYVAGGIQRSIENFSFIFRDQQKGGHWEYLGNNAIKYMSVKDSWIRNIYIKNSDHGISLNGHSRNISVVNILLDQFVGRSSVTGEMGTGKSGHMPIVLTDADNCLTHNILITGSWHHPVVTQGAPNHNVFSRYRGPSLKIDHHSMGGNYNLFTDIDAGHSAVLVGSNNSETYWGIRSEDNINYPDPTGKNVIVGMQTAMPTNTGADYWHETLNPSALHPANLYLAQLAKRKKPLPVEVPLTVPALPPGSPIMILPVDDSMVSGKKPDIADPYGTTLMASNSGQSASAREAYLKFDLKGLDLAGVVVAKLKVYMKTVNKSHDVDFHQVTDDSWTERTITYNNRPAGGDLLGTLVGVQQGQWVELDITPYVLNQIAADRVVSVKMTSNVKDCWVAIPSSEEGNAPILRLEKQPKPPSP